MNVTLKPEVFEKWPPQGWKFVTVLPVPPGGKWEAPNPLGNTFRQQVDNIISWRRHNPVIATKLQLTTNWETVAQELTKQTIERLQAMRGGDTYLIDPDALSIPAVPSQKKTTWDRIKRVAAAVADGEQILSDWLGDGGMPVDSSLSNFRAEICSDCPKNAKKHWSHYITGPVADAITATAELKHQVRLTTHHDSQLGTCTACLCWLPLKVHVPLKYILYQMRPEVKKDLDPRCWITKERL